MPEPGIYRIRITLNGIEPPVWRRIEVPGDLALDELHEIVQIAMGWTDSHLHAFVVEGVSYSAPDLGGELDMADESAVRLGEVARPGSRLMYEYDFGDGWMHGREIEAVDPPDPEADYPRCTGGARACPPEDCGGVWGYEDLLEIMKDTTHEEHDETLEWLGGELDPEELDLDEVNQMLGQR